MGIRDLLKQNNTVETKPFTARLKISTLDKINTISDALNIKKGDVVDSAIEDAYILFKKLIEGKNKNE